MSTQPANREAREHDRLVYGGLIGLGAATVLQLADKTDLDGYHLAAIYSFAGAIPLLAGGLIAEYARQQGRPVARLCDLFGAAGGLGAVAGFASLLFHFGPVPGTLFLGVAAVTFLVVRASA